MIMIRYRCSRRQISLPRVVLEAARTSLALPCLRLGIVSRAESFVLARAAVDSGLSLSLRFAYLARCLSRRAFDVRLVCCFVRISFRFLLAIVCDRDAFRIMLLRCSDCV